MTTRYETDKGVQVEAHQWDGSPAALSRLEVFVPYEFEKSKDGLRFGGREIELYYWLVRPLADESKVTVVKNDVFVKKYRPAAV